MLIWGSLGFGVWVLGLRESKPRDRLGGNIAV